MSVPPPFLRYCIHTMRVSGKRSVPLSQVVWVCILWSCYARLQLHAQPPTHTHPPKQRSPWNVNTWCVSGPSVDVCGEPLPRVKVTALNTSYYYHNIRVIRYRKFPPFVSTVASSRTPHTYYYYLRTVYRPSPYQELWDIKTKLAPFVINNGIKSTNRAQAAQVWF